MINPINKPRKRGLKFWLAFWIAAAVLLSGWYVFLQIRNRNLENLKPFVNILPIGSEKRDELRVLADIYQKMGDFPSRIGEASSEKTFLVLFQNDMELRPGGGFIGSFGIVKMSAKGGSASGGKDGRVADIQVFDTGIFDGRIPNTEVPPAPFFEILGYKSWKMRDSNWSPDFKTNAEKAEYFYKLGSGPASSAGKQENFDGVVAVNTDILNSILSVTGPVKINDFPGEYNDQTGILQLEYQVEKGFQQQGIEKKERKLIMKELAEVLTEKAHNFTLSEKLELAGKIEGHLKRKDIQIYFKDAELQKKIDELGWGGRVREHPGDYLMAVDANLNSLKSDYCIRRKMNYNVDFRGEDAKAVLNITYEHTCRTKDWMTADYRDWLRVYVPRGAWLGEASGQEGNVTYSEELGKKVYGMKIFVPVGQTRTVTIKYNLPKSVAESGCSLLVQKQSGSGDLPVEISVRKPDGSEKTAKEVLSGDKVFEF